MAWSYSGDPSSCVKDEIRFLVGDTDITEQLVSDEEINYISGIYTNMEEAAYEICVRIAAKFARLMNTTTGKTNISYSDRYEHYKELAAQLNAKFSDTPQVIFSSQDEPQDIGLEKDFDNHSGGFI